MMSRAFLLTIAIGCLMLKTNGLLSHPTIRLHRLHRQLYTTSTPSDQTVASDSIVPEMPSINMKFDNIVNMRDLCTASSSVSVVKAKIFRTGCVSKASDADIQQITNSMGIKVWVDLRSPAEVHEDENLNSKIYDGFEKYQYDKSNRIFKIDSEANSEIEKKRYFVSLMSESLIKKGVFFRLRKRTRAKAIGLVALSAFSRRAGKKVRNIFIDTINSGGLSLLNELVIDASGHEIVAVMKLIADNMNYPIGLFCTAGKDRTGLIAMLTLHLIGATDEEIIADYVLSDNAYKDINNSKAMVVAMKQVDVDPKIFLRADPQVMKNTMNYLRTKFGSIERFLDAYGFDKSWQDKLRSSVKNASN